MFTQDQIKQLQQLLQEERAYTRKMVREEVEAEATLTRKDGATERLSILSRLSTIEDRLKNVELTTTRLEQGQAQLEQGQEALKQGLARVEKKLDTEVHDLAVNTHKIMTNIYTRDELDKRFERIEDELELPHLH